LERAQCVRSVCASFSFRRSATKILPPRPPASCSSRAFKCFRRRIAVRGSCPLPILFGERSCRRQAPPTHPLPPPVALAAPAPAGIPPFLSHWRAEHFPTAHHHAPRRILAVERWMWSRRMTVSLVAHSAASAFAPWQGGSPRPHPYKNKRMKKNKGAWLLPRPCPRGSPSLGRRWTRFASR
jgi:hypothetical protein